MHKNTLWALVDPVEGTIFNVVKSRSEARTLKSMGYSGSIRRALVTII